MTIGSTAKNGWPTDSEGNKLISSGESLVSMLSPGRSATPRTQKAELVSDESYLMYLGAGNAGFMRGLWNLGTGITYADGEIRIYSDCGDVADPLTHELTPAATLPWRLLCGNYWGTDGADNIDHGFESAFLDYDTMGLQFYLPVIWSDGILIQNYMNGAIGEDTAGYQWGTYEAAAPHGIPSSWRLRTQRVTGTVNYDNSVPYAANSTRTWLNVGAGKSGVLLGLFCAIQGSVRGSFEGWCENNWELYPDQEATAVWQATGIEDVFGPTAQYGFQGGEKTSRSYGNLQVDRAESRFHGYRWFDRDPIYFNDGIVGKWSNHSTGGCNVTMDTWAVYLGEV